MTTTTAALTIVIPYSMWRVPVEIRKRLYYVNLSQNGDVDSVAWATHPKLAQVRVDKAKAQAHEDAWLLTLEALNGQRFPVDIHAGIPYSIELRRINRGKDPDEQNIIGACKWAVDGIARGLVVDDRHFRIAGVTVTRTAGSEETVFRVGGGA